MLHMNPRENGRTFTHDSVAGLMPRAHWYEHIDAAISSIQARNTIAPECCINARAWSRGSYVRDTRTRTRETWKWRPIIQAIPTCEPLRKAQVKRDRSDFSLIFWKFNRKKGGKENKV